MLRPSQGLHAKRLPPSGRVLTNGLMPISCAKCGAANRELSAKPILTGDDPYEIVVAGVCETCVALAIDELRTRVNSDDEDAEMDMLLLIALLKAHGVETTPDHGDGRSGMDAVRHGLLAKLDTLERQLLCSKCFASGPESQFRILPWFNEELADYVETFRCEGCFQDSMAETIARVANGGQTDVDGVGAFLQNHQIVVHEWKRGDDVDVVRPLMVHVLRSIANGTMKIQLGTTRKLDGA